MKSSAIRPTPDERLRASPSFALTFTLDGRPYIAKDTEPYIQYWLNERYRVLLSMFSSRGGATVDAAIENYLRLTRSKRNTEERKRLTRAIDDMRSAGVLVGTRDDTSRYTSAIVDAYIAHRPFPAELSELIIRNAPVHSETEVLDLAGGPGDLALALARASNRVSMMDLSRGFVRAAARRAKQVGLHLNTLHDSCNRLVFRDDEFDVVTISQALHWMDDVMVCRGLCRCLKPSGSFFVIHGGFEVEDHHPLAYLFGNQSILGHRVQQSFGVQAQALLKRLTLLFDALDAPDVHRVDTAHQWRDANHATPARIVPKDARVFKQIRPMDPGFARAFLTPQHIESTGQSPQAFWKDLESRCANVRPRQLLGTYHWALLHFRRDGTAVKIPGLDSRAAVPIRFKSL